MLPVMRRGGEQAGIRPVVPVPSVDRGSAAPLHSQVYESLAAQIHSGTLQPGDQLMHEKDYAAVLGVSLAPVRQAVLALVRDGYLYRQRGRGTFVRERRLAETLSILSSFSESLRATGLDWEMRLVTAAVERVDERIPAALRTDEERLLRVQRLALLEAEPVALLSAYFSIVRFPGLEGVSLGTSLYQLLRQRYGVEMTSARNVIGVASCRPDEAALLGLPRRAAVLEVQGVTHDQKSSPVEYSRVLYRPDRFQLQVDSHRRDDAVVRLIHPSE